MNDSKSCRCRIENCDYKELLKSLCSKSIDLICIDPPYGKINGLQLDGQKEKVDWDFKIDWKEMFSELNRVIKDGGTICVFGQNPMYAKMILSNIDDYKYDLIWEKNNAAQGFHSDKSPLNFIENIAVFVHNENKTHKRTFNNIAKKIEIDKEKHFCRWYAQQMVDYINKSRRKIHSELGHRKLEYWFYYTGEHFGLLSEELYNELIEKYKLKEWDLFVPYKSLKEKWEIEKERTKNLKLDGGLYSGTLKNIFKVAKENVYLHPTQKPVELVEKLILMYSKSYETVLDCFMGSGSTMIASLKNKREFIGCDISKKYFDVCENRLKELKNFG